MSIFKVGIVYSIILKYSTIVLSLKLELKNTVMSIAYAYAH